jgi:hypothetical protein
MFRLRGPSSLDVLACGLLVVSAAELACSSGGSSSSSARDAAAPDVAVPGVDASMDAPAGDAGATDSAASSDAEAGVSVAGTVTVNRGTTLATLGPAFAGLSYEKGHLPGGFFSGTNAALVAVFDLLGPSVLRIGGNSVDETEWQPAVDAGGPQPDGGITALITPADVDALAAFAKAAGWKVIYGVDMKRSTPEDAALEAAYAASALGPQLYGFEIGNEVDLYTSTLLSATWSYDILRTQWEAFAAQIRASVPGAPLTGPASAANYKTYTVPNASDEASRIELLTQHYYRANGQLATSTLALLLQPDPALVTMLEALAAAATTNKIPSRYRIAECNSFYNGGAPGISDAYGTALWAIDYLFTTAEHGASGVNFHGGGDGPGYTPIADSSGAVVGVRPEFYGMLLFTHAGTGPILETTASAGGLNFTAYAVKQADGSTRVVLVNKDAATTVRTTVDVGHAVTSADVTRLLGPSLGATSGVTLGGAAIAPSGAWSPAAPSTLPVSGNTVTVDVPPASAALVRAQ